MAVLQPFSQIINRLADPRSIYRSSANLIAAQVLTTAILFAVDILFARIFTKEEFGSWKHILLLSNFIIPIFTFGFPEGFKYLAAKAPATWRKLFTYSFSLLTLSALAILAIIFLGGFEAATSFLGNPALASIKYYFPLLFFFIAMITLFRYAVINMKMTKVYLFASIAGNLVNMSLFASLGAGLVMGVLDGWLITGIILCLLASNAGQALYMANRLRITPRFQLPSSAVLNEYLKFGLPLYLTTFIALITLNIDKLVVSHFGTVEQFAVFSIGAKEIPFIAMVGGMIAQVLFPRLVKSIEQGSVKEASDAWVKATLQVSYLTYPIILVLMYFAEEFITLFFSARYAEATPIFQTYLLILLWRNNSYGALLTAKGKTTWITFYSVVSMVSNVVLSIILYNIYGMIGVVYATFASVTIVALLQLQHERMLIVYFTRIVANPIIFITLGLIIAAYLWA